MIIYVIADTHGFHRELTIPDNIDMIIHAGDIAVSKSPAVNTNEVLDFLDWYEAIQVPYKILVAGNHDTGIEAGMVTHADITSRGIIYLQHESYDLKCEIEIEFGHVKPEKFKTIKIFGSPYTPTFNNWAFNVRRDRLHGYWQDIPQNTDILITHGPPKGILDLAYAGNILECCGDTALLHRYAGEDALSPKYHIFGHIHNNNINLNSGMRTVANLNTKFINASCVTDRQFSRGLTSKGHIIEI